MAQPYETRSSVKPGDRPASFDEKSDAQRMARKQARKTNTHKEWVGNMNTILEEFGDELFPGIPKEMYPAALDALYEQSASNRMHRLKALQGATDTERNLIGKDVMSGAPQENPGIVGGATEALTQGLTGFAGPRALHGAGAAAGSAVLPAAAAAMSGGLSIPFSMGLNVTGAGLGSAAGGAAGEEAAAALTRYMIPRGSDAPADTAVRAEHTPIADAAAGVIGSGAGMALSGLVGGVKGSVNEGLKGLVPGARNGLRGFLGIKPPVVVPEQQAALKALPGDMKADMLSTGVGEPGTSAIVKPAVDTDRTLAARNSGLEVLDQQRGKLDAVESGLDEGLLTKHDAEKEAEKAAQELQDLRFEKESLDKRTRRLREQVGLTTEAAAKDLAQGQRRITGLAGTRKERVPLAIDETLPEGEAARTIHDFASSEAEAAASAAEAPISSLLDASGRPFQAVPPSARAPLTPEIQGAVRTLGGDPEGLNAKSVTKEIRQFAQDRSIPIKDPPITHAEVPRTPQQTNAAALSPQAADLGSARTQQLLMEQEQTKETLKNLQSRYFSKGNELDDLLHQETLAEERALQAQEQAKSASRGFTPEDVAGTRRDLATQRNALSVFDPPKKADVELPPAGHMGAPSAASLLKDLFNNKLAPKSTFGIRAESPEAKSLAATGRLFDLDRYPGGPTGGASYGPTEPVSDIFTHATGEDLDIGTRLRQYLVPPLASSRRQP